jgi:hypothetical protein
VCGALSSDNLMVCFLRKAFLKSDKVAELTRISLLFSPASRIRAVIIDKKKIIKLLQFTIQNNGLIT